MHNLPQDTLTFLVPPSSEGAYSVRGTVLPAEDVISKYIQFSFSPEHTNGLVSVLGERRGFE